MRASVFSRVCCACLVVGVAAACGSSKTPAPASRAVPKPLAPLSSTPTTSDQTIVPSHAVLATPDPGSPNDPASLATWIANGYGITTLGAGEPITKRAPPDGQVAPAAGPKAKMLVRFVHLPDLQLADDESPTRFCSFDSPADGLSSAFRPQEGDQCRVVHAAVRTINAIHTKLPVDFVLMGGDNADSAQGNEIDWAMQILDGAPNIECDSGNDDDPVPGPDNDGKDPFVSEGLAMPWKWVTGNHDVLIQGNFAVDDDRIAQAVGATADDGTRDYTQPGAPITHGPVPVDPRRAPLRRADLMKTVAGDKDGHGIGADQMASGKAFYSFDVANTALRFVVLDTCAETGGSEGVVHQHDVDTILAPMLDKAVKDGKSVVIASHHATSNIGDGTGLGGSKQADALTADAWVTFLGKYPNILFSIVGHTHLNRVRYVAPTAPPSGAAGGHAFWEVMTSALADYPHQFRLIEIWDDDNGWLRLRGIVTNYSTEGDSVAGDAKTLGVADHVSGWVKDGYGDVPDRNVELMIPKPK